MPQSLYVPINNYHNDQILIFIQKKEEDILLNIFLHCTNY